jgi:hypothetical protein
MQQREARIKEDKLGDKEDTASGRRTQRNEKGDKPGVKLRNKTRQGFRKAEARRKTSWETRETRLREDGHTTQQRKREGRQPGTKDGREGRLGRQGVGKAEAASNKGTCGETRLRLR